MATLKASDLNMTIYLMDIDEFKELVFIARDIADDPDVPQRVKEKILDWVADYNEKHPNKEI